MNSWDNTGIYTVVIGAETFHKSLERTEAEVHLGVLWYKVEAEKFEYDLVIVNQAQPEVTKGWRPMLTS